MEVFITATTTLMAILIALLFFSLTRPSNNKKLPPGPAPFPIIGCLHKLSHLPHKSLADLAKIHGPVMSLKLGRSTTVVFSSSATAKEILQKRDLAFSTRSVSDALHAHDHSKYSVIWLPVSDRWRSLRKILNTHIFSVNRLDATHHLRTKKVEELISYCQKRSESCGDPVDIGRAGFATMLNLLSNTIFSKDLTDLFQDSAREFKELVWNIMVEGGKMNLVDYFPWLKRFDPQGRRRRMGVYFSKILTIFDEITDQRLESRRLGETDANANDVLDVWLNLARENPDEFDRVHMERMFLDLFAAGTDTTSSTLEWAMSELLRNPETMIKAKLELEQVVGKGKILMDADLARLPYLGCIVKESIRLHPPAPLLVPRKVETDVEACGYIIPKGAQVLVNVWAMGRDPSLWDDPLSFKPERFLGSKIDLRGQDFEYIPFGAGRRICPGLPLATRMVPVMLGSLINCFDWKIDDGIEPKNLDMGEKFGITLAKAHPLLALPTPMTQ